MLHRCLHASLVLLLFCPLFLIPVATYGAADHLLISEVLYDPAASEPGAEWVELYNPTANPVDLAGWGIKDNTSADPLPAFILGPGQYLVIASNDVTGRANRQRLEQLGRCGLPGGWERRDNRCDKLWLQHQRIRSTLPRCERGSIVGAPTGRCG